MYAFPARTRLRTWRWYQEWPEGDLAGLLLWSHNLLQFQHHSKLLSHQDEVVRMKQQVSALLRGEDLPEGAQAREVAEVPYEVPSVPRGETTCPVCRQSFKSHHRVKVHMGVHRGEKFPCGKCGKVLATGRYWTEHTQSCVRGKRVACPVCHKQFASAQTIHKHHKAQHGTDSVVPPGRFICPFCGKSFWVKKTWSEHKPYCATNPDQKGPYFVGSLGVRWLTIPSPGYVILMCIWRASMGGRRDGLKHHGSSRRPTIFGTRPVKQPTIGIDRTRFLPEKSVLRGLVGTSLSLGLTAWCSRPWWSV